MGSVTARTDFRALDAHTEDAFRVVVRAVEVQARAAHEDPVWGWNGETRRRNGMTVGSPRDVVDQGTLRDSQQPAQYANSGTGYSARIAWDAEHAAAVYLGAVFRKRAYSLPARNVPRYALQQVDVLATFTRALRARL